MGQVDKASTVAPYFAQNSLLPPTMWQHLLGPAHDVILMPYEQAEIEEYSWEVDEAEEANETLQTKMALAQKRSYTPPSALG